MYIYIYIHMYIYIYIYVSVYTYIPQLLAVFLLRAACLGRRP